MRGAATPPGRGGAQPATSPQRDGQTADRPGVGAVNVTTPAGLRPSGAEVVAGTADNAPDLAPTLAGPTVEAGGDGDRDAHREGRPRRVAAYLLLPRDPVKAAALRAKLVAFQRTLGIQAAVYEELPEHRRHRPKRSRLVRRARRSGFDIVCVVRLRHLAPTRARVAHLVLSLGVPVVALSGLRLDPTDRVVRWVAQERTEHRKKILRALEAKRRRGERVGAIPSGFKLAEDGVHLVPDDDTRRAMATARELVVQGLSLREIGVKLTEAGHRTRRGGPISHKQVGRWLVART